MLKSDLQTIIKQMTLEELLQYMVDWPNEIKNNKWKQVVLHNAIEKHQRNVKRARDLLAAIKENI